MAAVISAPLELIETISEFKLPAKTDRRLQELMDRNTEGCLADSDRPELEALVELSERLSLIRAQALHLLGKQP